MRTVIVFESRKVCIILLDLGLQEGCPKTSQNTASGMPQGVCLASAHLIQSVHMTRGSHLNTNTCAYRHTYICMSLHIYTHSYVHVHGYTCTCVSVYVYVHVRVCVFVYASMYTNHMRAQTYGSTNEHDQGNKQHICTCVYIYT